MKLEVGMHVRTENGKIWLVTSTKAIDGHKRRIINASHNIIDLIEPLDLLFIDIDPHDGHGGIVVPRVPETMNEVKKYVDGIKKDEIRLVGIVPRKAIQSNCYWLEKGD